MKINYFEKGWASTRSDLGWNHISRRILGMFEATPGGAAPTITLRLPSFLGKLFNKKATNRILNLGSGENPMKGAMNVDIRAVEGVDVVADATKLPFKSGSFNEVHSINPYGFNPVSVETARVMQPGAILRVTGNATRNSFARPLSPADAKAAGFEIISTGPVSPAHVFGVQRSTTGKALNTSYSTTTTYRKIN